MIAPVAEFRFFLGVEWVKAGSHDDCAHAHFDELVLLLVIDCSWRADQAAHPAGVRLEVEAVLAIDDRHIGHSLGKRNKDIAPAAQPHVKVQQQRSRLLVGHVGDLDRPGRADELAGAAGDARL